MSDIDDAIDRGDARELLRFFAKAELADRRGEYCQCAEPDLTGRKSHLCFKCGLHNLKRASEIEAAMKAPHPFEPLGAPPIKHLYCDFCVMRDTDPRHRAAAAEPADERTEDG